MIDQVLQVKDGSSPEHLSTTIVFRPTKSIYQPTVIHQSKIYLCELFEETTTMAVINFQFEDTSIASKTVEGNFEDLSILELTEEYDVHLNHNCGGVCACSTCHLYVEKGEDFIEGISDKEEDFIDRAINPRIESRLACQCIILDNDAQITVTIPDQKRIIGHEH